MTLKDSDLEKRQAQSAYDTLKGVLTGLGIDNLRFSYLMRQLDVLYKIVIAAEEQTGSVGTGSASTVNSPGGSTGSSSSVPSEHKEWEKS